MSDWTDELPLRKRDKRIVKLEEALRQCLAHIEADEAAHGRPFAAGNVARAALATEEKPDGTKRRSIPA